MSFNHFKVWHHLMIRRAVRYLNPKITDISFPSTVYERDEERFTEATYEIAYRDEAGSKRNFFLILPNEAMKYADVKAHVELNIARVRVAKKT